MKCTSCPTRYLEPNFFPCVGAARAGQTDEAIKTNDKKERKRKMGIQEYKIGKGNDVLQDSLYTCFPCILGETKKLVPELYISAGLFTKIIIKLKTILKIMIIKLSLFSKIKRKCHCHFKLVHLLS